MKYTGKNIISCISLLLLFTPRAATAWPSWLKSMPNEQALNKEFPIKTPGLLSIDNLDGSLSIKAGNQPKVFVSAVKHASHEDDLDEITIDIRQPSESSLHFTTKYDQKDIKGGVDYTLVIPANMDLKLTTRDGSITVHGINGQIEATTKNGDIELVSPKKRVKAHTKKTGGITVHHPGNVVSAHTTKGAIAIYEAEHSITATTDQGNIEVTYTKVPHNAHIKTESNVGDILLYLPADTNAELKAKTDKGGIRCDHEITVKSFTTQLNNKTWNKLKKEVHGTIGSGEALIKANSKYGSIKVFKSE
jgi:hypothetical protein